MIKSMTGYGKETVIFKGKTITIEVKSINSKQFDLSLRLPPLYREKEMEIRSVAGAVIERGKTEVGFSVESSSLSENYILNQALAERYYHDLKQLAGTIGEAEFNEYLPLIARLPDVFKTTVTELNPEEWELVSKGLSEALDKLNTFRTEEGEALKEDFIFRVRCILKFLQNIEPFEQERLENVRSKLDSLFSGLKQQVIDKNRFEQEMIYYMEKLDITEEKIRLKKHCEYFLQTIEENVPIGKKLGFIAQEMGREINTLGSKANHFEIQRFVVLMKDELEKIKEQLLNVL